MPAFKAFLPFLAIMEVKNEGEGKLKYKVKSSIYRRNMDTQSGHPKMWGDNFKHIIIG
ncbi:hypothetical protein [Gilliamella sp. Pas-s25]|uniref:hypothetical protein n=1 Tax=Gilliamella sp. Pas-s25 TaxID=2687310 RepID=UPI00135D13AA|nr:hypothetical protein [Gilliamella sp. Pas-s25]MWP62263.1 hypothetical protein [Gilliamella sp. Pas-s25]